VSLRIGRVVEVHPEDNSVDLVMIDDGSRVAGVQILSPTATGNTGTHDLPSVGRPGGDKWNIATPTDRDMIAVVGTVGRQAVVLGFLFPQVCQMLFKDANRRVTRHASDVYTTVDGEGNTEVYHPSGTYLRIGTNPEHEDLTGKDFDGRWKIAKNTDKAVSVRLRVANAGAVKATLTIDPGGNVSLQHTGDLLVNSGGMVTVNAGGMATVAAPAVTLDTPTTHCTGNLTVAGVTTTGSLVSTGSAGGASLTGNVDISGGSLTHNGKNIGSTHTHTGVQPGGGTSGAPS